MYYCVQYYCANDVVTHPPLCECSTEGRGARHHQLQPLGHTAHRLLQCLCCCSSRCRCRRPCCRCSCSGVSHPCRPCCRSPSCSSYSCCPCCCGRTVACRSAILFCACGSSGGSQGSGLRFLGSGHSGLQPGCSREGSTGQGRPDQTHFSSVICRRPTIIYEGTLAYPAP